MFEKFISAYVEDLVKLIKEIDQKEIEKMVAAVKVAYDNRKMVFVIGNGGSAATGSHFAADFGKNAVREGKPRPKVLSLSDNMSAITAYGNDMGYENTFVEQLKNLLGEGDIVIAISASGNSPNIISAAEYVKEQGNVLIGISGFKGGKLGQLSDVHVNVPSEKYEPVEDVHLALIHMIVYCFKNI